MEDAGLSGLSRWPPGPLCHSSLAFAWMTPSDICFTGTFAAYPSPVSEAEVNLCFKVDSPTPGAPLLYL